MYDKCMIYMKGMLPISIHLSGGYLNASNDTIISNAAMT